jgi:uncharacterized protein GlcG (DUF336 family)
MGLKHWIPTLVVALTVCGAARAQTASPAAPPKMAPPYGAPITLAQAKAVMAAAEAEAGKLNANGAVFAVVQPSGALVLFEKMDGSTYISIQFAQAKARASALYRAPSGPLPPGASALPDMIPLPGGVPIVIGGRTVGALGVSGVEGGQDVKVAEAAAGAVQ